MMTNITKFTTIKENGDENTYELVDTVLTEAMENEVNSNANIELVTTFDNYKSEIYNTNNEYKNLQTSIKDASQWITIDENSDLTINDYLSDYYDNLTKNLLFLEKLIENKILYTRTDVKGNTVVQKKENRLSTLEGEGYYLPGQVTIKLHIPQGTGKRYKLQIEVNGEIWQTTDFTYANSCYSTTFNITDTIANTIFYISVIEEAAT